MVQAQNNLRWARGDYYIHRRGIVGHFQAREGCSSLVITCYIHSFDTDGILANTDAAHELQAAPATPQGSIGVSLFRL